MVFVKMTSGARLGALGWNPIFTLKIILLILASLTLRPATGGQNFTVVGLALSVAILGLHFVETPVVSLTRHNRNVVIATLSLWFYLGVQAAAFGSRRLDAVEKAVFAHILVIIVFGVVLSDQRTAKAYFKTFIVVLALPVASYLVTLVLAQYKNPESLFLGKMEVRGYEDFEAGSFYFPFTPIYARLGFGGLTVLRFQDFLREAGIAQVFLAWAFIACDALWRRTFFIRCLLGVGMVATLSTAGLALLPLLLMLGVARSSKALMSIRMEVKIVLFSLVALLTIGAAYYTVLNVPYIGLMDKSENAAAESVSGREDAAANGLALVEDHPLGIGMYEDRDPNAGVNLIGALRAIGLPGLLLVLATYCSALFNSASRWSQLFSLAPILVTGLFSQPLIDAPLIYVLLLFNEWAPKRARIVRNDRPTSCVKSRLSTH